MNRAAVLLFAALCLAVACSSDTGLNTGGDSIQSEKLLYSRHIDQDVFFDSIANAMIYDGGDSRISAGLVPHHTTASVLISGFFKMVSEQAGGYDVVVVIAPNHNGDVADIILSPWDWAVGDGIAGRDDLVKELLAVHLPGVTILQDHQKMESDHSASVLMPYIEYYLPDTAVVPILVSRTLSLESVLNFAGELFEILYHNTEAPLIVCSADFSHDLLPWQAAEKDKETEMAMMKGDLITIHGFSNEYIDSPAALIIFLEYLSYLQLDPVVIDHRDASEFLGEGILETTSYFILTGQ